MTATLGRPLRARAGLRAVIYRLTMRADQTPAHHPLRLQVEEELADLKARLTEVEQYIGAFRPRKPSKLAAATEVVPIRDLPRATRPASVARGDASYARGEETCLGWTASEKHEPGDRDQIPSIASIAARHRLVAIRSLHRAGALAAHVAAGSSSSVQRMLEMVGESVIEFRVIVLRVSDRFTGHARRTFSHCGVVATQNCRHAVILTQQGVVGSSLLLRQAVETLVANGEEFRAFVSRTLSRSSDRLGVLLGSCLVAAANLRRLAGALIRQRTTASVAFLHQSTQMVVAANMELWRLARQMSIRTSDRISAVLGQCRGATDRGVRRAYAAVMQCFAATRRLFLRKGDQPESRWAESFCRVVVFHVADGGGAATGACRRAAERAGAGAKRHINAGRFFLQKVMAAAPNKGAAISAFFRRLSLSTSGCARKALAVSRPAAIQALRNAQSATVRSAARCQQISLESLRTARAKWTELSGHAALAGAAIERRAAPKLQQAGVQARRGIVAGRLFLQKVMAAAPNKGAAISAFCHRLSLPISGCARKALAVSRPAAVQALRNAQLATLRSAARCQRISLESLRTARAKWTKLSRHAALAGAAMERRAAPELQQAGVQAKRVIAAGRLFLQKVIIVVPGKGSEISTFCRRLSLRISDSIKKSAGRLPPLRGLGLTAQDTEPTFGVGPRVAVDGGNAS